MLEMRSRQISLSYAHIALRFNPNNGKFSKRELQNTK